MSQWGDTYLSHRLRGFDRTDATLDGLASAVFAGASDIEVDVRRDANGVLFVHHDPFVTGRNGRILLCHEASISELEAFAGRSFPILEAFLDAFSDRKANVRLHIDLKICGAEKTVLEMIRARDLESSIAIVSWVPSILLALRATGCEAPLCFSYLPFDRYGMFAAAAARRMAPMLSKVAGLLPGQTAREAARVEILTADGALTQTVRDGVNPAFMAAGPPPKEIFDAVIDSDGYFCVPRRLSRGLDWMPEHRLASFSYHSFEDIEGDRDHVSIFYCDFDFVRKEQAAG